MNTNDYVQVCPTCPICDSPLEQKQSFQSKKGLIWTEYCKNCNLTFATQESESYTVSTASTESVTMTGNNKITKGGEITTYREKDAFQLGMILTRAGYKVSIERCVPYNDDAYFEITYNMQ